MKLGLCLEMVFTKLPFEKRIEKAAKLGFKFIEMWFTDMTYKGTADELARIAKKNKVTITNTVIGSPDGSIGGGLTNPKNRKLWLERTRSTLDYTRRANIPATIVCTGNTVEGLSEKKMFQSVVDGLKATADLAEKAGITLLLEPLNTKYDHAGYWCDGSDKGAEICRAVGSKQLKMLFDCYHMQIMEGDLVNHIKKHISVIGHFHSAGVPGRHELFTGETNYPLLLKEIEKAGYKGVFAMEYAPSMPDEKSLKLTLEYLKRSK
ncbi:MAG: TIM barrel protein [Phycisphaerae bacterium]